MLRHKSVAGLLCLLCTGAGLLSLEPAAASAARPASITGGRAASATYVKEFGAIVNGSLVDLAPVDVQPTSDGGAIAVAETETAQGLSTDWLVKLGPTGTPQWQEEVGCASPEGAPGDGADGVSVQQTADGGYILGGGTIDCGSGSSCPPLSGRSCALAVKLSPAGDVTWARVYQAGPGGSEISQIRQTADGGYIAVGSFQDLNQDNGGLILKLDGAGNVQWQRDLGSARRQAIFDGVEQTAAGSYVAVGEYYVLSPGEPPTQALVAKFTAAGHLSWQRGFARLGSNGAATSVSNLSSIVQTPDGGYAVAGRWSDQTFNGNNGAKGALLLKLGSGGNLRWQQAYSGGVYCYFNGFSETCAPVGGVSYSLHQASDGGYVLAGDSNLELSDSAPIVPWQAKVGASGNLLWQHFYYQTYKTGRTLTEFFPASAQAPGGFVSVGPTENYPAQKDELYAVRTDGAGLAGNCADVHTATPLQAMSPQLTETVPALPVHPVTTAAASSPVGVTATAITTQTDC